MTDLDEDAGFGKPRHKLSGKRARMRRTPGGALALKVIVFVIGLAFIALGAAALVLPGPLTIPPVLIGLYVWSTEFAWADRLLDRAKASAEEAWKEARKRPVMSAVVTVSGLVATGVAIYVVMHYGLIDRARQAVGL